MIKSLARPVLILILFSTSLLGASTYVRSGPEPFIRTELYFGRNITGGGEVSKKEFDKFLAESITPRFPEGLTVLGARGQFLNSNGEVEREGAVVVILLYSVTVREEKQIKIDEIREEYKARFRQLSVLRVDDPSPVWASF